MKKEFVWTDELVAEYLENQKLTIWEFKIMKNPKPLFTTEDGVEIFENDTWYWVSAWNIHKQKGLLKGSEMYDSSCAFSTEEKSREYILMNKPCLSVSDVYNIFTVVKFKTSDACSWLLNKEQVEIRLEGLAKQKINP